jgi:hypothetical protein
MRTTLTIDDDIAVQLERLRRARDGSLKDLINDALQRGLREMTSKQKKREPFHTQSFDLGPFLDDGQSRRPHLPHAQHGQGSCGAGLRAGYFSRRTA